MIVISKSQGQLGNQIFQYINLHKEFNKNKIILIDFENIRKIFKINNKNIKIINKKDKIIKYLMKFIRIAIKIRILTSIYEDKDNSILKKIGLFKNIIYINGFFQSEKYLYKKKNCNLEFQKKITQKANKIIEKYSNINYKLCFIHIRKGDYRTFYIQNKNVVLPHTYYTKSIRKIQTKNKKTKFIILTDENKSVPIMFRKYEIIKEKDPSIALRIMTMLNYGIISNSSLSWLGGFFGSINNKNFYYIAPKNHLGYNVGKEIPKGIHYKKFTYINNVRK